MSNPVPTTISERIFATRRFLDLIDPIPASQSSLSATCKGLVFVKLYAIYEYTVRASVRAVLADLQSKGAPLPDLKPQVLSLILEGDWAAARNAGRAKTWDTRIRILDKCHDGTCTTTLIDDTVFPADGSHYRPRQLLTIWRVFDISDPTVPDMRFLGRIEEFVEHRNAIAHGRETPDTVGRRYSKQDIADRIDDVDTLCTHIWTTVQAHHNAGGVLK